MLHAWKDKNDATLLSLIREGSHQAFATLVERHASRFYAVAYRFVGQRQEAEDMVQEAFIKLWERPELWQADRGTKFTTWFYRVVVNLCLDRKKRYSPLPMAEGFDPVDEMERIEERAQEKQMRHIVEQAIAELPERQQMALNLCFYEGLSNQEAAEIMNVNIKALQSLVMRAKAALKETFAAREIRKKA